MLFLYRVGIWLYGVIIRGISPFHQKASSFSSGRNDQFSRLEADFRLYKGKLLWIHAASLGEFEQGRPIIQELKKQLPGVKVLLTFFSPSGYEVSKDFAQADYVHYLPLDTRSNAKRFLAITRPDVAVFIKYEFWYFFLEQLQESGIPTLVVSAVFRDNQWFFHPTGHFLLKKLKKIDWFFVQDRNSLDLLKKVGIKQAELTGDTRFDRVYELARQPDTVPEIETFKQDDRLMILGSVWPSDIKKLEAFIKAGKDKLKLIIAPHELEPGFLNTLDKLPDSVRYTNFKGSGSEAHRILILDTVGQLAAAYRYSDFAYVGGGFRGALHNLLEPAAYGQPVFFGEHTRNLKFVEAGELVLCGGGISFYSLREFTTKFDHLWADPSAYREVADASRRFVKERTGATGKVVRKIIKLL